MAQPSFVLRGIQFRRLPGLSFRFVKPTGKDSSGDKDSPETRHDKFPTNSDGSANRPQPLGSTWQPSKPVVPASCPSPQRLCAAVSALQCPSALLPASRSLTFLRKKRLPKENCQKLIYKSLEGDKDHFLSLKIAPSQSPCQDLYIPSCASFFSFLSTVWLARSLGL